MLPNTVYVPNFKLLGPSKQKLQSGGGESALLWPYQSAKRPACLGLKCKRNVSFIPEFERAAKIRKIAVYRFLISLLVPEL